MNADSQTRGGPLGSEQERAVLGVQRLTGLDHAAATRVLLHDLHDGYKAGRRSILDDDETLKDEVRAAIADFLDTSTAAGAAVVASLLDAVGAPWSSVNGDTLELRLPLPDDRLILTGEDTWSYVEVPLDGRGLEFWWTGIADDCPDALVVADALDRMVRSGHPVGGRRAMQVEDVAPRCAACGDVVARIITSSPDAQTQALEALGYVVTDVTGEGGAVDDAVGVCRSCGQQRTLAMEGYKA